jgi:hypothetical protein
MTREVNPNLGSGITKARRLSNFAAYFKNYMGLSAVFIAALPIPVTQLGLIPVVPEDKGIISTLTSIICFILIAFIFSVRRSIAIVTFRGPERGQIYLGGKLLTVFTFSLVVFAVMLFFEYHRDVVWYLSLANGQAPPSSMLFLFGVLPVDGLGSFRTTLVVLYTSFFACVSSAFVLLAIKEYMQDVLGLDDATMIRERLGWKGPQDGPP